MPSRPPATCAKPGCGGVVTEGICSVCGPKRPRTSYDDRRGSAASRGYGAQWQRRRRMYLRAHPVCVHCGAPASDVDHIVARKAGGGEEETNLQALCHACHNAKTAGERRGRGG